MLACTPPHCVVTGLSIVFALGFGCQSLIAQAFGAGNLPRVGLLLKRIISLHALIAVILIVPLWIGASPVLKACYQPDRIIELTQLFLWWRLPALPFLLVKEDIKTFLMAQRITWLPMVINVTTCIAQVLMYPLLILPSFAGLGFIGAPIGMTIKDIVQCIVFLSFAPCLAPSTWPSWRDWRPALRGWGELIRLGL